MLLGMLPQVEMLKTVECQLLKDRLMLAQMVFLTPVQQFLLIAQQMLCSRQTLLRFQPLRTSRQDWLVLKCRIQRC
jgi:hypothetical protein